MSEYAMGTDAQGNARFVRVPPGMTLDEVKDAVEWALDPPYGSISPITWAEVKKLAKLRGQIANRESE